MIPRVLFGSIPLPTCLSGEMINFIVFGLDPSCSLFSKDEVMVLKGGSSVRTNDRVNEVLVMGVSGEGWIQY